MSESEASPETPVERAEFDELGENAGAEAGQDINLDVVLNVDLDLALEVGRTTISVKNLLQLNQGSVVELDRLLESGGRGGERSLRHPTHRRGQSGRTHQAVSVNRWTLPGPANPSTCSARSPGCCCSYSQRPGC